MGTALRRPQCRGRPAARPAGSPTDYADRQRALAETRRVLRPGGVVLAAAISRFASSLDSVRSGAIADPDFAALVAGDLHDGVHRNPDPEHRPEWFTLGYFHHPDELREEVTAAGPAGVTVLAVEGVASFAASDDFLDDPIRREAVLQAIRRIESEPSLLGRPGT